MNYSHQKTDLIRIAIEYNNIVDECFELLVKYEKGEVTEDACWPKIHERERKKDELLDKATEIKE